MEETSEQVYELSSSDETSSETTFTEEDIENIPLEVKQRFQFLSALDESLTKAFRNKNTSGDTKTTKVQKDQQNKGIR